MDDAVKQLVEEVLRLSADVEPDVEEIRRLGAAEPLEDEEARRLYTKVLLHVRAPVGKVSATVERLIARRRRVSRR